MIHDAATLEVSHSLRRRIQRSLGQDVSLVRVGICEEPRRQGAWGLSHHGAVMLAPEALRLHQTNLLSLLGHELCHAAQQFAGRAGRCAGVAALERQAERWGDALASGQVIREPVLPAPPGVSLHAVWIGGRQIESPTDLDSSVESLLSLINGAGEWLRWAIRDTAVDLRFGSEPGFSLELLRGLHNTDLIPLRRSGLLISPFRLLEMGKSAIDAFVGYEGDESSGSSDNKIASIIKSFDLVTTRELDAMMAQLRDLGVGSDPVFGAPDLGAQITLYRSLSQVPSPDASMQKQAASFAADRSTTAAEFAHAYQFYLTVAGWESAETNLAQATLMWEVLAPDLVTKLLAPQMTFPMSGAEIVALPDRIQDLGLSPAFRTQAAGARQVVAYLAATGRLTAPRCSSIEAYLDDADRFVGGASVASDRFGQDGRTQCVDLKNEDGATATLVLDETGCLTLDGFTPNVDAGMSGST